MIGKAFAKKHIGIEPGFEWRGDDITRIEGLSDAVFAFAVTLLVVSLEVPKTYDDLYVVLKGLPAFAMSFILLMMIWYNQYKFFRRYGLQDFKTVILTIALLFVILFYVYPLKFLFTGLFAPLTDGLFPHSTKQVLNISQSVADVGNLMILYHIGVIAIYGVFLWMYSHAFSLRNDLKLNEVEILDTKESIVEARFLTVLATSGLLMACTGDPMLISISGIMYGPVSAFFFTISGGRFERKRKDLLTKIKI